MTIYSRADDLPGGSVASGGCIRFGRDGIYLHHNDAHFSVGISPDFTFDDKGRLVVKHSAPGPIITMGAFPDESLVARNIALGCSGGVGTTIIVAAKDGRQLDLRRSADYDAISGEYCNAWIYFLHALR